MESVVIGNNHYRGRSTPIVYQQNDRLRHMYMVGKTGVGKSTIFQNMCLQDILNHNGVCFIDPRFGARPVKRFVEETCETLVAKILLNH